MTEKSTEYLCEQVTLDLLSQAYDLGGILKARASDRIWTEEVKSIVVKAGQEETVAPSLADSTRVVRMQMEVTLMSVIPEEDASQIDKLWSSVHRAITTPSNVVSLALLEFSHFTISGVSSSQISIEEGRYAQTRVYSFIVVRR